AGRRLAAVGRSRSGRLGLAGVPVVLALVAGLAGPAAYAAETVASTHTGSIPSAGPAAAGGGGLGGGPGGGAGRLGGTGAGGTGSRTGTPPGMGTGTGTGSAGTGAAGTGSAGTGGTSAGTGTRGGPDGAGGTGRAGGTGGPGGLSGDTQVSSALVKLLEKGASGYKWVAATVGSQEAAPLELAMGGEAVMAIGGFNGTDPSPTLAEFKAMVAKGEIHYYLGANSQSFGGGNGSSAITKWVEAHYTKETVGSTTVYDLTKPASS
ncbi:MAG TPA: glycosyl transferase, partial [Streptosporangiaceae bacterium]